MDSVTVRTQADLPDDPSGTVTRQVVFDDGDVVVVQSTVGAGVTTDWHHNGDRHVYGFVVSGRATLEYGPGGREATDLAAGGFVYVPPHTVRRVVNSTAEPWTVVISFVGSGPLAVSVDGPAAEPDT